MIDAQHLYSNGFHPQFQYKNLDFKAGRPKHYTRTQLPPKYYLIDFGISIRFDPSLGADARGALPIRDGDISVPEYEGDGVEEPTDPFATDVYFLGNLIRTQFLDGQRDPRYIVHPGRIGFEFMRPLVNDKVKRNPKERPTIDQVVDCFKNIVNGLSAWKLRSRVCGKDE
ncbi:hypothetical protein C8R44DRAFT_866796 [Mycena epipterygia]|nr:hypothetical protein C8R44DRAFT_866796 [Mycena epipterygia]